MTDKRSTDLSQVDHSGEIVEVMITLERPRSAELVKFDRKEKFRVLQKNSEELRTGLMAWIKEQGLADEVVYIGMPTAFNLLFVKCTRHAVQQLLRAPGVVDAAVTDDTRLH
jgi:hypothetical protein